MAEHGLDAPQVLCFGEALIDRLGPPGGDPALDRPVDDRLGGAPANVACALARLGTPVAFLGRLGDDSAGAAFQRLLNDRGVDQRGVQLDPKRPTRIVLVRRTAEGERVFQGFAGEQGVGFADQAVESGSWHDLLPSLASAARWLLIGTIPQASPASAAALHTLLEWAADQAVPVALDVNWRPTFWDVGADPGSGPPASAKQAIRRLLEGATLIKLAREEALWFFQSDDPVSVSQALPQRPDVVVTDGAQPVRCCIDGAVFRLPVLAPPQVVDTTGAGDAFTAGLLHCWDRPINERLRFAAACGALVCAGAGAIDPQPTHQDAELFAASQS